MFSVYICCASTTFTAFGIIDKYSFYIKPQKYCYTCNHFILIQSGYGSQAVSSATLSSDDSMSLRSISVDDTPDTEVPSSTASTNTLGRQNPTDNNFHSQATASSTPPTKNIIVQALKIPNQTIPLKSDYSTAISVYSPQDLLSPPDVSIHSISPGEDTDATVTVEESTPSSANITPSLSGEQLHGISQSTTTSLSSSSYYAPS